MSKLNTAQRKALPSEDYGDPAARLFPIVDQQDIDSAAHLIGKAKSPATVKARIIAIAKRKGLTVPDAWKTDAKMTSTFALEAGGRTVDGDYAIYPNSLLFQAGDYADKSYSMTPEEMWAAVEQFMPVGGNIEHSSFLSGRACEVRSIHLDPADSGILRGVVAVPLALDSLLEGHERKLSCEWDRGAKTLTGMALTVNPRIPDAALMSNQALVSFAAASPHTTREGQSMVQTVHDLTAKGGAVCTTNNPNGTQQYSSSYFVSSGEAKTLQGLHDACTAGGAKCSAMQDTSAYAATFAALFAGNRHNKADQADIQSIHNLAAKQGASCIDQPAVMNQLKHGGTRMSNKFSQWFGMGRDARDLARDAGAELPDEAQFGTVEDVAQAAREAAHQEELAKLKTERDAAQRDRDLAQQERFAATAQRLQGEAAAFADGLILGNKLLPAEREGLIAALTTAGMDDAAYGVVTFAAGGTGSRVEQLKTMYAARPAHDLTKEQLSGNAPFTVVGGGKAKDASPDSYDDDKLLRMTPAGTQAANRKKA